MDAHHLDSPVDTYGARRLTPKERGLTAATLHAQTKRRLDALESQWEIACEGSKLVRMH